MSILKEVLEEELDRLERQEIYYKAAIKEYPKGYVSRKSIQGKIYYYLQHRDGEKIVSKYIPVKDLHEIGSQIKRRKRLEESLQRVKEDKKRLKRILK